MTRTPLSRSKGQRSRLLGRFTHSGVYASGSCSGDRGNVFTVGTYCYAVRRGRLGGARRVGAHIGRRGARHIVAVAHLQLVQSPSAERRAGVDFLLMRKFRRASEAEKVKIVNAGRLSITLRCYFSSYSVLWSACFESYRQCSRITECTRDSKGRGLKDQAHKAWWSSFMRRHAGNTRGTTALYSAGSLKRMKNERCSQFWTEQSVVK